MGRRHSVLAAAPMGTLIRVLLPVVMGRAALPDLSSIAARRLDLTRVGSCATLRTGFQQRARDTQAPGFRGKM